MKGTQGVWAEEVTVVTLTMNIQKSSVHDKKFSHIHAVETVHPIRGDMAFIHEGASRQTLSKRFNSRYTRT
jgi:hypothetical protein